MDQLDHLAIDTVHGDPQMGALHVRIVDLDITVRSVLAHQPHLPGPGAFSFRSAILDNREFPNRQASIAGVHCSDREQTHSLISLGRSEMSFVARRLAAFSAAIFFIAASGSCALAL